MFAKKEGPRDLRSEGRFYRLLSAIKDGTLVFKNAYTAGVFGAFGADGTEVLEYISTISIDSINAEFPLNEEISKLLGLEPKWDVRIKLVDAIIILHNLNAKGLEGGRYEQVIRRLIEFGAVPKATELFNIKFGNTPLFNLWRDQAYPDNNLNSDLISKGLLAIVESEVFTLTEKGTLLVSLLENAPTPLSTVFSLSKRQLQKAGLQGSASYNTSVLEYLIMLSKNNAIGHALAQSIVEYAFGNGAKPPVSLLFSTAFSSNNQPTTLFDLWKNTVYREDTPKKPMSRSIMALLNAKYFTTAEKNEILFGILQEYKEMTLDEEVSLSIGEQQAIALQAVPSYNMSVLDYVVALYRSKQLDEVICRSIVNAAFQEICITQADWLFSTRFSDNKTLFDIIQQTKSLSLEESDTTVKPRGATKDEWKKISGLEDDIRFILSYWKAPEAQLNVMRAYLNYKSDIAKEYIYFVNHNLWIADNTSLKIAFGEIMGWRGDEVDQKLRDRLNIRTTNMIATELDKESKFMFDNMNNQMFLESISKKESASLQKLETNLKNYSGDISQGSDIAESVMVEQNDIKQQLERQVEQRRTKAKDAASAVNEHQLNIVSIFSKTPPSAANYNEFLARTMHPALNTRTTDYATSVAAVKHELEGGSIGKISLDRWCMISNEDKLKILQEFAANSNLPAMWRVISLGLGLPQDGSIFTTLAQNFKSETVLTDQHIGLAVRMLDGPIKAELATSESYKSSILARCVTTFEKCSQNVPESLNK